MLRWIAIVFTIVVAAGIGLLVGFVRWGSEAAHVERVEQRLQTMTSETSSLQEQKKDLEQRLEQVSKEQERLAHENDALRKQQTTEQLLSGKGGELPALPPK